VINARLRDYENKLRAAKFKSTIKKCFKKIQIKKSQKYPPPQKKIIGGNYTRPAGLSVKEIRTDSRMQYKYFYQFSASISQ
jgi:hypothetical protein